MLIQDSLIFGGKRVESRLFTIWKSFSALQKDFHNVLTPIPTPTKIKKQNKKGRKRTEKTRVIRVNGTIRTIALCGPWFTQQ